MDDRVDRLLDKAEKAIDRNDTDQAEAYAQLAGKVAYLRKQEAKMLDRQLELVDADRENGLKSDGRGRSAGC